MNCNCLKREGRNCIELVPIFNNLTYEEMVEIAGITIDKTYNKGEMIYMAGNKGEKLYVIHQGKVKISRLSDTGKEQVIRVLGPGDFMGELSLFNHEVQKDNAQALDETIVCIINGDKIKDLMLRYPTIALKILEELSQRLESAEDSVENINLYSVSRRLAEALIDMGKGKDEIILNMSRRDFASYLGMSSETLSRNLTSFQELGFIQIKGHRKIRILDREALLAIE